MLYYRWRLRQAFKTCFVVLLQFVVLLNAVQRATPYWAINCVCVCAGLRRGEEEYKKRRIAILAEWRRSHTLTAAVIPLTPLPSYTFIHLGD